VVETAENSGESLDERAARLDALIADVDWKSLPDGASAYRVPAPSGSLAAIAMGPADGDRVVLVPGVTGSKEDFILMMPLLAAQGYRVESFDMAGQYESASAGPEKLTPPRTRYAHDLFVNDLLAVLDSAPGAAHVLGYSFAGTVAQLAFSRRPDRFASLTLLSCPPEPGQGFRGLKRLGRVTHLTTGRAGAALMIWGLRRNIPPVPASRHEFVRARLEHTRRSSVADIISLMKRSPDLRPVLAAAEIPRLVAVGEHDLWPLHLHAEFADSIGARLAVYPTGHSPCETAPHQLVRDMLKLFGPESAT